MVRKYETNIVDDKREEYYDITKFIKYNTFEKRTIH